MAKIRRNGPCPCGSGSKAKRCCYGTTETVGILPSEFGDDAIVDLAGLDETELRYFFDQLLYLPELDTSLQTRLPGIITPDVDRAINALRDDEDNEFDEALDQVVSAIDAADRRIELARALITLRDAGRIPPQLAAVAVLELDREESMFFRSSVAESIAILAGDQRTPSGLVVSTR